MTSLNNDIQPLDDNKSEQIACLLTFALDLARTRSEVVETFNKNKYAFDLINETQKNKLRSIWREKMEMLK